jgi:hypothetical protein
MPEAQMDEIVLRFLRDLAKIDQLGLPVRETDVGEAILVAILEGYIKASKGYALPQSFEMLSEEGDTLVHAAIKRFRTAANQEAERRNCFDPNERIALVRDPEIPPPTEGEYYANFFRDVDYWPL